MAALANIGGVCRKCGTDDRYAAGWEAGYMQALGDTLNDAQTWPERVVQAIHVVLLRRQKWLIATTRRPT